MRPLALAVLSAALALSATGCMSDSPDDWSFPASDNPSPDGWVQGEPFPCSDFDVLWETSKIHAVRGGYRIDDDGTSQSRKRIVTAWKVELAPRKGDGCRRRRFIEVQEVEGRKNQWRARVSTVVQRNMDLDDPLNAANAEWRKADPDVDDAERVLWMLEARFRDFGPSKEFEIT
ncbi:MAG TPA: hypothetical protein VFS92_07130 [Planctomycetota bacterium]|nr:hypothetical protein [Planctomycetota bacterium]